METTEKVPKLRFKSFNDNYFKNKLGDVISIFRGSSPRPKGDPLYYGGNIPRLMIRDATRDGKFTTPVIDYLTKEGAKKSRYLKKGSVVLSCSGTVVAIPTILAVDACIHDGWFGFSKLEKIDTEYLYYFFLRFHSRLQGSATTGGVFNNLTVDIMKSVAFSYPKLLEQKKIASFLSSVDDKISQLEKKKTLLETYKRGIMQKIFSQELRFKDENGQEFPEWEEKKLSQVVTFRRGSFPQPYGLPEWYDDENGFPFVQVYDVADNFRLKDTTKRRITDLAKAKSVFVPKGSIVLTIQGSIGRIAITQYDSCVDRTLLIFKEFKLEMDKVFFSYVTHLLFEIEKRKAPGGTIKTITKEKLSSFLIKVPTLNEQKKIASFLSSIDNKIEITSTQLDKTREFKKGLLQQMFV